MFEFGVEVDTDTWMVDAGNDKAYSDKDHPHCYVDAKGVVDLFPTTRSYACANKNTKSPAGTGING